MRTSASDAAAGVLDFAQSASVDASSWAARALPLAAATSRWTRAYLGSVEIRRGHPCDREALAAIDIESIGLDDQAAFAARVAEQRLFVAVLHGAVIGYLAYGWLRDRLPTI